MKYKKGFKYVLEETEYFDTEILLDKPIKTRYLSMTVDGNLRISIGYPWDGPSGPTIDTKTFMRGSLIHDALYELIRKGHLRPEHKQIADKILFDVCIADGMWNLRAEWVYVGVSGFGKSSTLPKNIKEILEAP